MAYNRHSDRHMLHKERIPIWFCVISMPFTLLLTKFLGEVLYHQLQPEVIIETWKHVSFRLDSIVISISVMVMVWFDLRFMSFWFERNYLFYHSQSFSLIAKGCSFFIPWKKQIFISEIVSFQATFFPTRWSSYWEVYAATVDGKKTKLATISSLNKKDDLLSSLSQLTHKPIIAG